MEMICISGKAGHGKDTIAGMIKKELENRGKNVLITHYGDLLKYICKTFFGWNGEKDEAGRTLLQQVGTEGVRYVYPDFWVKFIADICTVFADKWDYVLIPDTRFPNEIEYIRSRGFSVSHLRIHRPGHNILTEEQQKHLSETALDGYPVDIMVENDGTLEDLNSKASELVEERIEEKINRNMRAARWAVAPIGIVLRILEKANDFAKVNIRWDEERCVWTAASKDIPGLALESGTFDSLVDKVKDTVPELVKANGMDVNPNDLRYTSQLPTTEVTGVRV